MAEKMKIGIVGAGVISKLHAKGITANPEAEFVAVCDIEEDKAKQLAEQYSVPRTYQDYEKMFATEDLDIVSVCVPSGDHHKVTIAAAQAGIHVLCEKPLDITSEAMSEMISACRKHNVKLGGVYQRRLLEAANMSRQAIHDGKLGRPVLGDAYLKYYRSPEYYASAGWRGTWSMDGGGALMNQGVHGVDLLQWMMGDVESVFAYSAPLVRDIEVEDTAVVALKYKNGAFGVIQGTTSVYPGQGTNFAIHGEKGTIMFNDNGFQQWKFIDSDEQMPDVQGRDQGSNDPTKISSDGHYLFIDDMIQAIREDRKPIVPGEEARKAVDLLLAIYESSRTGKEVRVSR